MVTPQVTKPPASVNGVLRQPLVTDMTRTEVYSGDALGKLTGSITGTVRDRATDTPISGAYVFLLPSSNWTRSDANGEYVLSGVPLGVYTLLAFAWHEGGEYNYGEGRTITITIANRSIYQDIDLIPVRFYRQVGLTWWLECDHGDSNPFNAHGWQSDGPLSRSFVLSHPDNEMGIVEYTFDYNHGGYFHIDYDMTATLGENEAITMTIDAKLFNAGDPNLKAESTLTSQPIAKGATWDGTLSVQYSQPGYHNGPSNFHITVKNDQLGS